MSEEENCNESCFGLMYNKHQKQNIWYGKERYKNKKYNMNSCDLDTAHGSEEIISTDSDWDSHFTALAKTHNTFTLTSNKVCHKKDLQEISQKSGGDTQLKEEDYVDSDYKKIKPREWDKDKSALDVNNDKTEKDGTVYESKTYKDQRKAVSSHIIDKKKKMDFEKKETIIKEEESEDMKKDKKEKVKEIPRETKSKKYSDTRKERLKQTEPAKQSAINKIIASDGKSKLNHDDIKPFTQLPLVKTDDLTKIIEDMDRKARLDELQSDFNKYKEENTLENFDINPKNDISSFKMRRNSLESGELPNKDSAFLKKQMSLDDRSKSSEREGSEEPEKSESGDRRTERRIRNKDRPSLVIYQPGMGKFSKRSLAKEKETQPTGKPVNDSEKKDT